jgi:hypothetical protein
MRTLICLTLLSLTHSLSAQQTNDSLDTLQNFNKGRYTFRYPKSWSIDTSKLLGSDLILRSPKTDSLDDFCENMNIMVQDIRGQNYSLRRIGQESENQIKNIVTDVEISESRLDSAASEQYYVIRYRGRQGKFSLTSIQHYFFKDEVAYILTFTIKSSKETDYVPLAEKILATFKLN